MSERAQTLITVATYNERENLPLLVDAIFEQLPQVDLLVIDDNSPDGTGAWVDARAAEDRRVHALHRAGKLGLGTATIAGMRFAIERDYEFVLNMDADFSHHPRHLPALIAGMQGDADRPEVDVLVGSRYVPGGGVVGWPWHRQLMSRSVNLYARWLLGLRTRDCSGAFRCYRTARLKQLDFEQIISRGYSFQEELLWRLQKLGCRIAETPITFADRTRGQSKINRQEAWGAVRIIAQLGVQEWTGWGAPPRRVDS